MQVWSIPSAPECRTTTAVTGALISCIARADFAIRALAELNRALPVAWCTVFRIEDNQPPQLCAQASHAVPDIALDCWHLYRRGLYHEDRHFAQARDQAGSSPEHTVMIHCVADDFGAAHREQIYTAHSLSERLSLVSTERGALLAVNLYRHRAQPRFDAAAIDAVSALADTLLAVVQRQIELSPHRRSLTRTLSHLCPELTARELEVCERLLRGLSFEGIAADLQVSVTTVKTYRNRAFGRLGIHHRNELFGLALKDGR